MDHHSSRPRGAQEGRPPSSYDANLDLLAAFGAAEEIERLAPATRLRRLSKLLMFCRWLGDRSMLKACTGDVAFFVDSRGTLQASSRSHYLSALDAFYRWARSQDLVELNPAAPFVRQLRRVDRGPFAELAHDWQVAQERRGILHSTITTRRAQLRRFGDFLEPRSVLDALAEDVERWLDSCDLAARARYAYLSHLHAFYGWAIKAGKADTDPTADIDRPKLPHLVPRPISDADLAEALAQAPPRTAAWLALAAYQGMRCMEIAALAREEILEHLEPPMLLVKGKGRKERLVPLHPAALEALRRHGLPRSGHVFRKPGGRPISAFTVSTLGSEFLHATGSPATVHQLRHWFGTRVYARTRDLRMTQELLGHSSPTTTAMYVAFNPGDAVDAVTGLAVAGVQAFGRETSTA